MAAVLACGRDAVLSHRSAALLWGMLGRANRLSGAGGRGRRGPVDITVPGHGGRAHRKGIRVHRSAALSPALCTRRHGIPVTKPGRTLDDLRRARDARLGVLGYQVVRFTWRQIEDDAATVIQTIRTLLRPPFVLRP